MSRALVAGSPITYWRWGSFSKPKDIATKIEVNAKSLRVPIFVIRSGKTSLTIKCADSKHGFKVGTTPEQLQKFRDKLEALIVELGDDPYLRPASPGFRGLGFRVS